MLTDKPSLHRRHSEARALINGRPPRQQLSTRDGWEALRAHKPPEFNFEFQVGQQQMLLLQDGW